MRVSRIHSLINNQFKKQNSAFTQNLNANAFRVSFYNNKLNQNDVFVRLASASTRDAQIEKELIDMGLIK